MHGPTNIATSSGTKMGTSPALLFRHYEVGCKFTYLRKVHEDVEQRQGKWGTHLPGPTLPLWRRLLKRSKWVKGWDEEGISSQLFMVQVSEEFANPPSWNYLPLHREFRMEMVRCLLNTILTASWTGKVRFVLILLSFHPYPYRDLYAKIGDSSCGQQHCSLKTPWQVLAWPQAQHCIIWWGSRSTYRKIKELSIRNQCLLLVELLKEVCSCFSICWSG